MIWKFCHNFYKFLNVFLDGNFKEAKKMFMGFENFNSLKTFKNFAVFKFILWKVCLVYKIPMKLIIRIL